MNTEKYKILKVTVEQKYYIPMIDDERTKINGWTIEEVIDDWFNQHKLNSYHATRDAHEMMGNSTFIKSEVEESGATKEEIKYFVVDRYRQGIDTEFIKEFIHTKSDIIYHRSFKNALKELNEGFYDDSDYGIFSIDEGKIERHERR